MMFLDVFFPDFTVKERGMFRILRDSEVEVDEEAVDLVRMFEKALKRRRKGLVVDLTVDSSMPQSLIGFMSEKLGVNRDAVTIVTGLVGLADVKHLIVADRKALQFADFEVRLPERVTRDFGGDIFAAIRAKDLIVHHPFESFETVLMFVRQAARDPNVVTIKQTLYRTSDDSPIVKELIDAAEAGKTVTALIELKARFDEEANIRWARDMERAGVHVVYGFVELKTHAKVALAVRREEDGLRSYVHFGTGNYHPMTAKIYTDLSYFTASPALGRDANRLFNFMTGYGKPYDLELVSVAPVTLRARLEELAAQNVVFTRDMREAERRIARGEFAIYLPWLLNYLPSLKGLPVKAAIPQEGVVYLPYASSILTKAPHPNAARVLIDFMLSDEGQTIYASEGLLPTAEGFSSKLPPDYAELANIKLLGVSKLELTDPMVDAAKALYK